MKTVDSLDSFLKSINESGIQITDNVTTLKNEIEHIENSIMAKSKDTVDNIKGSLDMFLKTVDDSTERIRSLEEEKSSERCSILSDYYTLIVEMRKDLSTYAINSTDEIIASYDEFSSTSARYIEDLLSVYKEDIKSNNEHVTDTIDVLESTLNMYKNALISYNSMYSDSLKGIVDKISSIVNLFNKSYNEFVRRDALLTSSSNYVLSFYEQSFNEDNERIIKNKQIDTLKKKYLKRRKKLIDTFLEKEEKEIKRIESGLLKVISSSFDVKLKIKDLKKIESSSFGEVDNVIESIFKENSDFSSIEFKNTITDIYKDRSEKNLEEFRKSEHDLENEFLKLSMDLGLHSEFEKRIADISRNNQYLFDTLNTEIILNEAIDSHKGLIKDRTDNIFSFSVEAERMACALNRTLISYEFENSLISLSLNNDLNELLINMKTELALKEIELKDKTNKRIKKIDFLSFPYFDAKRYLDYRIEELKINRKYIAEKSFCKEAYELLKLERKLDLVEPTKELLGIIKEYDALISGYEFLYNSEVEILERSKERNDVSEISNHMYLLSMIKHRTMVADSMLDLARKEYDLKISLINDVTTIKKRYAFNRTEELINQYMEDRDEIKRIRDNDLRAILDRVDEMIKKGKNATSKDHEDVSMILDDYKKAEENINLLLSKDPTIMFENAEMENFKEYVKDDKEMADLINEELLKNALNEIIKSENGLDEYLDSLENESVDYNVAFDTYKFKYNKEKERINAWLDEVSSPYLERISDINKLYNFKVYIDKYEELSKKHKELIDKNHERLMESYNSTNSMSDYFIKDYSATTKNVLENKKKSLDDLIESFREKKDALYTEYQERIASNEERKIERIEVLKKSALKSDSFILSIIDDEKKMSEKQIKLLRKVIKKNNSLYLASFDEIERESNKMFNDSMKELDKKYKAYSLYDLTKKDNI